MRLALYRGLEKYWHGPWCLDYVYRDPVVWKTPTLFCIQNGAMSLPAMNILRLSNTDGLQAASWEAPALVGASQPNLLQLRSWSSWGRYFLPGPLPYAALWPHLLYHLSYKTQREREMSGPTNSSFSAGLWEKNTELRATRKEALEVWWPRKKTSWSWLEEGVPQIIRDLLVLIRELKWAVWAESSLWKQGTQMAAASNPRSFSGAAWKNSMNIS